MAIEDSQPTRRWVVSGFTLLGCLVAFLGGLAEVLNFLGVKPPQIATVTASKVEELPKKEAPVVQLARRAAPLHLVLVVDNGDQTQIDAMGKVARALAGRLEPQDRLSILTYLAGKPIVARPTMSGTLAVGVTKKFFEGLYDNQIPPVESAVEAAFRLRDNDNDPAATVIVGLSTEPSDCRVVRWSSPTQFAVLDAKGDAAIDRIIAWLRPEQPSNPTSNVVTR